MKLCLHGLHENRQGRCTRARFSLHLFLSPTTLKMALDVRPFGGIQEQEQVAPCFVARQVLNSEGLCSKVPHVPLVEKSGS